MRSIPLALILTLGCAAPSGDRDPSAVSPLPATSTSEELPPPPYVMTLTITDITTGQPFQVRVTGATPGAEVFIARSSAGAGVSQPIAGLGGLSLDLLPPMDRFGPFIANNNGVVTLTAPAFATGPAGATFGFQAAVPAGAGSYISNRVVKTVLAGSVSHDLNNNGVQRYPWGVDGDDDGDGAITYLLGGPDHDDTNPLVVSNGGNGTFAPAVSTVMLPEQGPTGVALGDFDDDGNLDVVTTNQNSDSTSVYRGLGNGQLGAPSVTGPIGGGPVAVGDFDEDGSLDYVATYNMAVFHNDGGLNFTPTPAASGASGGGDVQVLDVNNDGHLDIAGHRYGAGASVALGVGDGTFTGPYDTDLAETYASRYADFNLDGFLDVALGRGPIFQVQIFLGDGSGFFSWASTLSTTSYVWNLGGADFNGDGAPDLVSNSAFGGSVDVWMNDGAGNFTRTATLSGDTERFANADFNGDGNTDVLISAQSGSSWLALGAGDGTFSPLVATAYGAPTFQIAVGDMNGDGILDQVAVDISGNSVGVSLGQ